MLEELCCFNWVGAVIVFLYGALIGSFLNVVIYRLPLERSIVWPGSACGTCGTPLRWWENLPIAAYLFLGGRCATCGSSYSWRYAAVEAFTALSSVYMFYLYDGINAGFLYAFLFFCLLLAVFFTDFDHWIIPDSISYFGIGTGILCSVFQPMRSDFFFFDFGLVPDFIRSLDEPVFCWSNILSSLYGMILGTAFYWAIQAIGGWIIKQEAMGSGDIKFAALIGAFLGWHMGIISFAMSFVLGALTAVPILLLSGKRGKDPLPLGTFMAVAAMACMLWRDNILLFIADWPALLNL